MALGACRHPAAVPALRHRGCPARCLRGPGRCRAWQHDGDCRGPGDVFPNRTRVALADEYCRGGLAHSRLCEDGGARRNGNPRSDRACRCWHGDSRVAYWSSARVRNPVWGHDDPAQAERDNRGGNDQVCDAVRSRSDPTSDTRRHLDWGVHRGTATEGDVDGAGVAGVYFDSVRDGAARYGSDRDGEQGRPGTGCGPDCVGDTAR